MKKIWVGLSITVVAVVVEFVVTLLLFGANHFEIGFGVSFALSVAITAVGYCVAAAGVTAGSWSLARIEIPCKPSYELLGLLVAVLMWVTTEVTTVIRVLPRFLGDYTDVSVSVLAAVGMTLFVGLLWGRRGMRKDNRGVARPATGN